MKAVAGGKYKGRYNNLGLASNSKMSLDLKGYRAGREGTGVG